MSKVILGITGGIAAYKATSIIRLLTEAGHEVKVIPTANALRFIGATTLEALSHNSVDPDLYTDVAEVKHVELGQSADLVIVAPATAAFLARYASGLADDLLLNTLLATKAPVLVAPAMHTEMWQNPATARNVETLRRDGVHVLNPDSGRLTGSDSGVGRLPEPEQVVAEALALLQPKDFAGKRVVVTAGGTQEPIDPVRFIGNRSSGKQGIALAAAAKARGAQVTLIGANIAPLAGVTNVAVGSVAELANAISSAMVSADVLIHAAAVSDYRVASPSETKLKKAELGSKLTLELVENPDLLVQAVEAKRVGQIIVGFAAETASSSADLLERAKHKLARKGCDLIVANDVSGGRVFDADENSVFILGKSGASTEFGGSKSAVANAVLDAIING